MSEAFTYCWTDTTNNKLYIGWHKGSADDGYICSSDIVLEKYYNSPENFIRQIIAFGTSEDMISLESAILRSVDAKNNPDYYNMHNNHKDFRLKQHSEKAKTKMRKPKSDFHKQSLSVKHADVSGPNNPMFGTVGGFFGKKHSTDTKKKMSEAAKNYVKTDEHRKNISLARIGVATIKGYRYPERTCPHCGLVGSGGNMTRHHFDNCKVT